MQNKDTVVAVHSDLHAGSTVAVCPTKWNISDGGTFYASPAQTILHRQWVSSANNVKDLLNEKRRRKRLIIVLNGEPIDGDHHETHQLITKLKSEQEQIAVSLLDEWMQIVEYDPHRGDRMYLIRGSTAHEKGEHINNIGRDLDGVVPYRKDSSSTVKDGKYYFDVLRRTVNGKLFDIAHHGFTVSKRRWLKSNNIRWGLISMYFDCLEENSQIPDYVIRSHMHEYTYDRYKNMWGCVTPAWQLKTNYGFKAATNNHINTIGMVYFDVSGEGYSKEYADYIKVEDAPIEEF
jgi:hypothetical protein